MFGRDPITPVAKLFEPRPRYYGESRKHIKDGHAKKIVHGGGAKHPQG